MTKISHPLPRRRIEPFMYCECRWWNEVPYPSLCFLRSASWTSSWLESGASLVFVAWALTAEPILPHLLAMGTGGTDWHRRCVFQAPLSCHCRITNMFSMSMRVFVGR